MEIAKKGVIEVVYLEHRKRYVEYKQACEDLDTILNEWLVAFQRTMPKISYGDKVQGNPSNKIEEYVIEIEQKGLRQRKEIAEQIIDGRRKLLEEAEAALRKSKNIYDLVYCCRWVDGLRPQDTYRKLDLMGVNYSVGHICEITRRIKAQIERDF